MRWSGLIEGNNANAARKAGLFTHHRRLLKPILTSWRAALRDEGVQAGVVPLGEAEVGYLEVGVVLLVHQQQVLGLQTQPRHESGTGPMRRASAMRASGGEDAGDADVTII